MRILESIDAITESEFDALFGRLRSALSTRPIELRDLRAAMLKMNSADPDRFFEQGWPYIEAAMKRIPGVYTRESGDSYLPIIVNLENERAFNGAAYVADGEKGKITLSAPSLKGLIDLLKKENPGGIVLPRERPDPRVGRVMVYAESGFPEIFEIRNSPSRLRLDRKEFTYVRTYVKSLS